MRRPLPVSLGFFVFAGIVYGLQLTPLTGVFLMILAGPFWSVVLINAGFLGTALEASLGKTNSLLLILPALWFGGYGAWAAIERADLALEAESLEKLNAQAVPGLPSVPLLIVDRDDYGSETTIVALVSGFAASAIYTPAGEEGRPAAKAYRFSRGGLCRRLGSLGQTHLLHEAGGGFREACVYSLPETAPERVARVQVTRTTLPDGGPVTKRIEIAVTAPDGGRTRLATATVAPLPWIPRPILGCALNSGMNEWQCFRQFGRQQPRDLLTRETGQNGVERLLAASLGLERRTPRTPDDPASQAREAEVASAASAAALSALEQMLAEPENRALGRSDVAMLKTRPDLLRPHVPAMMATVERRFGDEAARGRVDAFQMLLAGLPDADFEPLRPRFARLYRPGEVIPSATAEIGVMDRMGVTLRRDPANRAQWRLVPLAEAGERAQQLSRARLAAR